jgi:hypothetical protein
MKLVFISLAGLVYFISLFGFGKFIGNMLKTRWPFPFIIIVGLAGWIFAGGILNLLGLAQTPALDFIVVSGVAYAFYAIFREKGQKSLFENPLSIFEKGFPLRYLPVAIIILGVFVFNALTLASPGAFNYHDDLEKYLSYPIRMLATGSLWAGSFSSLGTESLGGQAFLHGFALTHWPLGYINAVDAVFAMILSVVTISWLAIKLRLPLWLVLIITLVPIFINPQYVNTSSIYTGVALILFLFLGIRLESVDNKTTSVFYPNAVSLGLAYSALVTLKSTFLFVVAVHFLILVITYFFFDSWKKVLAWAARVIGFSTIFLLPWILLYRSQIADLITTFGKNSAFPLDESILARYQGVKLFSFEPLTYGFGLGYAQYTIAILMIGLCGVFILGYIIWHEKSSNALAPVETAACFAPPILYLFFMLILPSQLYGPASALRYFCPVVIAGVPAALLTVFCFLDDINGKETKQNRTKMRPVSVIFALVAIAALGLFTESFAARIEQAYNYNHILSFRKLATRPYYLEYNKGAFSPYIKELVQRVQQNIPVGRTVLAWTPLAFQLDYKRNPILSVEPAGLASPWLNYPFGKEVPQIIDYFKKQNIDYLLWQNTGMAVRAERDIEIQTYNPYKRAHHAGLLTLAFVRDLSKYEEYMPVIYSDEMFIVLKLRQKN